MDNRGDGSEAYSTRRSPWTRSAAMDSCEAVPCSGPIYNTSYRYSFSISPFTLTNTFNYSIAIMTAYDEKELPKGWVREHDQTHNHPYWVDTQAKPPRAIWTHPYEDEQFLNEHPDIRTRLGKNAPKPVASTAASSHTTNDVPDESPPPYDVNDAPRRHSFHGRDKSSSEEIRPAQMPRPAGSARTGSDNAAHKRGFLGKLKDRAIGTKEEREEAKRQEALVSHIREYLCV
ncbi:hypothetical protein BC835DRAFT_1339216, partial [Cytidiella melzeri]